MFQNSWIKEERSDMTEKSKEYEASMSRGWLFIVGVIVIILLVWLLVPSGKSSDGETVSLIPQIVFRPPPQSIVHTLTLTPDWSMPVYLPDPLDGIADFRCDLEEYEVAYDVLINGRYLYSHKVKDQPVPFKEAMRSIQWRTSPDSPVRTGTMRYRIVPRTAH
jgi:hypothetical protein